MAQYISKDIAVAEIERRISSLHPKGGQGIVVTKILKDHYKDYLSFINTLEVKEVQEEPVSEDLEEAAIEYCGGNKGTDARVRAGFMEGAKWKEGQFKKNLLDACKKQTEEESEIERDFIEGFIENERRLPTFDDAIKYGMRLQKEQMMKEAIDTEASYTMSVPCITISLPLGVNVGDKVKVIIIKSE